MKAFLLVIFVTISFSASAQWWRVDLKFKKKPVFERPAVLEQVTDHSIARLPHIERPLYLKTATIYPVYFKPTDYSCEAAENIVMKTAQHNMRFRIYNDASYNFSELARLYILENRFSEAKWYLLQSNLISRQQNDDKHTVANLIALATIKINIAENALAQEDLTEAYDLARVKGLNEYLPEIEKKMLYIKQNGQPASKPVLRYAETPQNNSRAEK